MKKKALYNKVDKELLKKKLEQEGIERTTLSFYQYAHISNPKLFRDHFYLSLDEVGVLGRIYVSQEGVNGQISVPTHRVEELKAVMNSVDFLKGIRLNIAIDDDGKSFIKLKIKVRDKIVADGLDDSSFDVTKKGIHLTADKFNELTNSEDTIVIDMRNHYESEVGKFKMALTPDVETFREALPVVEKMLEDKKDKNIVMYCTGGIRCEKASAYYKHRGFKNVYQLDGGIIEYARQVEAQGLENKFIGKNFVFDERLGERISQDIISKCHQCGKACDEHTNCANDACHILFIQCEDCANTYANTCSVKCKDFTMLPEEKRESLKGQIEFNGTKFGKGRYKAHKKDETLQID
ncbi:MAG: rhodanese-related sulfurtransferase [Saprospiraceae bacterium]|nr:rhodanese-related sulfurtransferase [Saprospiraceae bacterium]